MIQQSFQPPFSPLARTPGSRIESFPESHALQFDGHPRLVPLISNQRINRVLSRFTPSLPPERPRGEKIFEPSSEMRIRLKRLGQTLDKIYPSEKGVAGEIRIKPISPPFPPTHPLSIERGFEYSPELEEIKELREKLVQKEEELSQEKSREKLLNEKIKIYQEQTANLTAKTQILTQEIEETETKLSDLRNETSTLRQKEAQEEPGYEQVQVRVTELKDSLEQSRQLIENLREKTAEKEKLLQKTLAASEEERRKAQMAISGGKSTEALVKNLSVALQNAREELKSAETQKIDPAILQVKEEQIQKLTERLQQKEEEAQTTKEKAEKLGSQFTEEEKLKNEIEQLKKNIINLQNQNQTQTQKLESEEGELAKLRVSVQSLSSENQKKQVKLQERERHLKELHSQKEKIASFADEVSQKLSKIQSEKHLETIVEAELGKEKQKKPVIKVIPAKTEEVLIKPLTNLPNAVNGMVMTADGNLIENAVVIIKDKVDNSLRALHTNELGQFLVATPLPNGTYHIEVEYKDKKFDILETELTGEVLAPIEIKAK